MTKSMLLKKNCKFYLTSFGIMFCLLAKTSYAVEFKCEDDIAAAPQDAKLKAATDVLYKETIDYLRGFISILTKKSASCESDAEAITQSHASEDSEACLSKKDDVVKLIEQSKVILDNPDEFRACFDIQKDYSSLELFTPNKQMQETSFTTSAVNRKLMTEYYEGFSANKVISEAGRELSENFIQIISNVTYDSPLRDMSYLELNHL
ncbi:MAG: hypothetical protein AAF669_03810 [Pseudomonadota bacterium]